jgi:TPR repeat protein
MPSVIGLNSVRIDMTRITVILAAVLSLAFTTVAAQDFQKGLAAYQAGDYATTLQEWIPAAEAGDAVAQYNLGIMYYNGKGVPQDYAEAVKWYRLAADQGNANAQSNLGIIYEYGNSVLQDNVMAHMWYNIASANGHGKAAEWRDERAGEMNPADISKAQAMARECMSSGYKKCGY